MIEVCSTVGLSNLIDRFQATFLTEVDAETQEALAPSCPLTYPEPPVGPTRSASALAGMLRAGVATDRALDVPQVAVTPTSAPSPAVPPTTALDGGASPGNVPTTACREAGDNGGRAGAAVRLAMHLLLDTARRPAARWSSPPTSAMCSHRGRPAPA